MTPEQVKESRKILGKEDLFVFCSDAVFYDGRRQGSRIVWDDEKQIMYSFRAGTEYHIQEDKPIDIRVVSYDIIEYVSDVTNIKEMKVILQRLVSESKITTEVMENIVREFEQIFQF